MNGSERVQALTAWICCGYPATDDDDLLEVVHAVVTWAQTTALPGGVVPSAIALRNVVDRDRELWMSGAGEDALTLLARTEVAHCAIAGCAGPVGQLSPQAWARHVLSQVLLPVAAVQLFQSAERLNEPALDRAAARTRAQVLAGERVTLPSNVHNLIAA